jgi:hypothetical protein
MSDESPAARRAHRDADALTEHLNRLVGSFVIPHTLVASIRRRAAEQLVTWGWTHLGPGEQVVRAPAPRNAELSLRDELAATIAGVAQPGHVVQPVELAEHLLAEGWLKLGPDEKVVTPMSSDEAFDTVKAALAHWEQLKKTARKKRDESAEVSADASELTSGVKGPSPESLILAAFAGANRPLTRAEAIDAAAGRALPSDDADGDRWYNAFGSLVLDEKIAEEFVRLGTVRRYGLTQAGRALISDGVPR